MDNDIYGESRRRSEYHSSIPAGDDDADYDVSTMQCHGHSSVNFIFILLLQDDDTENTNGAATNDYGVYKSQISAFNAPKNYLQDVVDDVSGLFFIIFQTLFKTYLQNHDPLADRRIPRVADREDEYRRRFRNRQLSPERVDVFADGMYLFVFVYYLLSPILFGLLN